MGSVQKTCSVKAWRAKNSLDVVEMSGQIQPAIAG